MVIKKNIEELKNKINNESDLDLKDVQESMRAIAEKFIFPTAQVQFQLFKSIQASATRNQETIYQLMTPMMQSGEKMNQIVKRFEEIIPSALTNFTEHNRTWLEQTQKVIKGLHVLHEKSQILAKELEKDEVFLIPYFGDVVHVHQFYDEFKKEKSMLEIYDEFFSEEKNLMDLLDSWMQNDFYKKRKPILEQCLRAHLNKQHELNIPVMYIHIEAYCKSLVGINESVKVTKWKKKLEQKFKSKDQEDELDGILKYVSEKYTVEIITDQIFRHYKEYNELTSPIYPNRHNVQHGDDITYYQNKYASLRCILLLDVLSQIEPKLTDIEQRGASND